MLTFLKKKWGNRRGFTLIELLVVIAIIGVLASIVLASLNTARRKSRDARRITDVKQLQLALELYFDASTEYPDTLALLAPTYIPAVPTDPSTQAAYAYDNLDGSAGGACLSADSPGSCLYYHLGAVLEEASNSALDTDSDREPAATWGFDGFNATDCGVDAAGAANTEICYDLTP